MFTGIIESIGIIKEIRKEKTNVHFTLESSLTPELKIDQSVAHNGVCLTVVDIQGKNYTVTAIDETLQKTNLGDWKIGHRVNLERSMQMNGRLDGHIVQGHVDQIGTCKNIENKDGSWLFSFEYNKLQKNITVEKGSICINGVSLTVVNSKINEFSVAIIPYTYEHTNFSSIKIGDKINLEFDILGKYVTKFMNIYQ